ncbi:hypothetical protein E8E14_003921 [Neopestalotiopsis sp. 37M]|nr:hypothetical protein E8E14_003921 [Neopestalotiopsis sp. 37M]
MQISHILIGLVGTVSAIDIYGYRSNEKCSGGDHIVFTNINPDDCAISASGNVFRSIGIRAIPTQWNIIGRAFTGGGCKNLKFVAQSLGRTDICLGGDNYSGGNYGFTNQKRFVGANETCPATGGCDTTRGDLMVFENGPEYNMTSLDDDLYNELFGLVQQRHKRR